MKKITKRDKKYIDIMDVAIFKTEEQIYTPLYLTVLQLTEQLSMDPDYVMNCLDKYLCQTDKPPIRITKSKGLIIDEYY